LAERILSYVYGTLAKPKSASSHISSASRKACICPVGLGVEENCSKSHMHSLKSPTSNHGKSDCVLRFCRSVHIKCPSSTLGSPYTPVKRHTGSSVPALMLASIHYSFANKISIVKDSCQSNARPPLFPLLSTASNPLRPSLVLYLLIFAFD
jgi:hypothetical protein